MSIRGKSRINIAEERLWISGNYTEFYSDLYKDIKCEREVKIHRVFRLSRHITCIIGVLEKKKINTRENEKELIFKKL